MFIRAREEKEQREERGRLEVMRWQSALMCNIWGNGKKRIDPKDLFKFDDENTTDENKRDINSEEAKRFLKGCKVADKLKSNMARNDR
ncbi:MAG: hypothetical protein IPG18_00940 [Saprospiraceae bacterium]|nr:hypothetical protein [Saprospiraceae bacterium]